MKGDKKSGSIEDPSVTISMRTCGPFVAISNLYGLVDSKFDEKDIVQATKNTFAKLTGASSKLRWVCRGRQSFLLYLLQDNVLTAVTTVTFQATLEL